MDVKQAARHKSDKFTAAQHEFCGPGCGAEEQCHRGFLAGGDGKNLHPGLVFGGVRELGPTTCYEYLRGPFHPARLWGGSRVDHCCGYLDLDQGATEQGEPLPCVEKAGKWLVTYRRDVLVKPDELSEALSDANRVRGLFLD
jgi:hypothetical protein